MAKAKRWPAEKPELWALDDIKPCDRNPRTHPEKQIELLAALMKKYGVDQPIVVDENGVILKGHGRRLAAQAAGFVEFPVVVNRGLSDNDKSLIRIADNQVSVLAGWDDEILKQEILAFDKDFDLDLLGFNKKAVEKFFQNDGAPVLFEREFSILIECKDEAEQLVTLKRLQDLDIKCRALIA
jgi:hypothetical protein